MSTRHTGKIAVVTGGSSGIGQAIVCRLAREGARVAIADVVDAEETLDLVRRDGGDAFGARCDISDGAQVSEFMEHVSKRFGSPQIAGGPRTGHDLFHAQADGLERKIQVLGVELLVAIHWPSRGHVW
jgi:NAD(P)-dependent dehydrogenase (short-subunit alcohol dehydrogenase family)